MLRNSTVFRTKSDAKKYLNEFKVYYNILNPQQRKRKPSKNAFVNSIARLAFVPINIFPYIPFIIFTVVYFVLAYLDNIFAALNINYVVPQLDPSWSVYVWGVAGFLIASLLIKGLDTNSGGRKAYTGGVQSSVTSATAILSAISSTYNIVVSIIRATEIWGMYLFAIKLNARGEEIKIDKLPGVPSSKKLVRDYIFLKGEKGLNPYDIENVSMDSFDNSDILMDVRSTNGKSGIVLTALFAIIAQTIIDLEKEGGIPPSVSKKLFDYLDAANTAIATIAGGAASVPYPQFFELTWVTIFLSLLLVSIIFKQVYGVIFGYFLLLVVVYLVVGIILWYIKIVNPFDDSDKNPYVGFGIVGTTIADISNDGAKDINTARLSILKGLILRDLK